MNKQQNKKQELKISILETAIKLYNEHGYNTVTVRDIAHALQISPGNITYHYKKKVDLMKAIFELQYDDYSKMDLSSDVDVEGLNTLFHKMISHQQKYYFYFNNIVEIPRYYPELSHIQKQIIGQFYDLYKTILLNFHKKGIVKDPLNQDAYGDIALGLLSIVLFWFEQHELHENIPNHTIVQVLWNNILPSFTDKGVAMYLALEEK